MSSPAWRIRRRNLTGRVRPRRGEPRVVFEVWMDPFPGGPYATRLWRIPAGTAEQVHASLIDDVRRAVRIYLADLPCHEHRRYWCSCLTLPVRIGPDSTTTEGHQ